MGLDICVKKIIKTPNDKDDYFSLVDEKGEYDRRGFPEWTKAFESETIETWYDWDKYKEETNIDVEQCEWHGESYGEDGCFMELWPKSCGKYPKLNDFKIGENSYDWDKYKAALAEHIIKINLDKVPTYQKPIKVLYYKEVGYQRKGFNSKFYSDYREGKIGYFVWTKAELERYKEEYCDDDEMYSKEDFQSNIIDNFTEGEDCVTFGW